MTVTTVLIAAILAVVAFFVGHQTGWTACDRSIAKKLGSETSRGGAPPKQGGALTRA